jgi:hypothetical protein
MHVSGQKYRKLYIWYARPSDRSVESITRPASIWRTVNVDVFGSGGARAAGRGFERLRAKIPPRTIQDLWRLMQCKTRITPTAQTFTQAPKGRQTVSEPHAVGDGAAIDRRRSDLYRPCQQGGKGKRGRNSASLGSVGEGLWLKSLTTLRCRLSPVMTV